MLYTRKGDGGTTKTFDSAPGVRISKSSAIAEALGSLDEINSFFGLCKVKVASAKLKVESQNVDAIIHEIQQTLFIIQAQLAGADKKVGAEKVVMLETTTDTIEKILPPIKTFFISGGGELAALFDIARTIARRAERRVVAVSEEGTRKVEPETLQYLNRLSSVLYALARLSNHLAGVVEEAPVYK
jgi:cob(I)alamin adenosyltransferase